MATQTTNYGLTLPANNDNYDVGDFNGNFSKIDAQMKANADAAKNAGDTAGDHTHGAITNDGKIGTAANKAVFTGKDGALKAGTLPIAAGARTPLRQTRHVKTSAHRKRDSRLPIRRLLHRRGWRMKHILTIRTALPFRSQALRLRALPKLCCRLPTRYPAYMRLCAKHMQAVYICMPTLHPARL